MINRKAPRPGRDRIDLSRKVVKGGRIVQNDDGLPTNTKNQQATIFFVLVLSVLFSFIYSEFMVNDRTILSLFGGMIDQLLFGPGYAVIIGDATIDQIINIFVRGLFWMAVFGIIPFLTYKYSKMRDVTNLSPYRIMWGMTAFVLFIVALIPTILWPFIREIFAQFAL